ncbi:DegT/DnrJ/EryC1/StrS family aminotransferase [Pseudoalteromonas sp. SR43-6]|uniref:DegT/DnrJ/EryC1/StrS family aminotransferase n=1 Tax=unclassified Pseudoalteromonas TaxID=194690 RepID=UPI0015FBC6D2|nr:MULTISPECIES: DegT/DnrJ/EryC1/StrS family aminotransferase [unclassified Pseudoalteromonas]MBB1290170.1 DegT/DnrJ/EryC1/StrS family aminotransferase [Pseudoalteromonas sp. SR41-5]MBB1373819.1 DegT/DnrJ/EryC1/StrS family aminotransferase [Pseudoalteromonas sp. SR43-6]MBB1412870.1 DegT/DnrJ/EryC1/StrS family aminotransferase [Pseudoalteromonas sp. SG43-8]
MIALNKPLQPNLARLTEYLSQVNDRGWYTNFGPLHEKLTLRLESYLGIKNLLLVSNGTLAIQVACKALGVNSAITTPFSFVATTSSLLWQGIETVFSDIDAKSYNLCPKALDKALTQDNHYDGIVATHVYGNPCDVESLAKVAKKHNKKIVYDAAHAFGVKVAGESVLNFGDASTLSFHATKVFHTVEGGAIVFKHKADFETAKQLINFGIQAGGTLGEPGINAKLNEYQCAVGLTLLDQMDEVLKNRATLFDLYRNELNNLVVLPSWHPEASLNGAYMPIYIECPIKQSAVLDGLAKNNIQSRRYFTPSLDTAYPQLKSYGCNNSQQLAGGVICLPLHNFMTKSDVITITSIIKDLL